MLGPKKQDFLAKNHHTLRGKKNCVDECQFVKNWAIFFNKVVQKLTPEKNIFNKKWLPKLYSPIKEN